MTSYLNELGIVCALGDNKKTVLTNFLAGSNQCMTSNNEFGVDTFIGKINVTLPELSSNDYRFNTRNNQIALLAFRQIEAQLSILKKIIEKKKIKDNENDGTVNIAVVIGTSTSGIASGEESMAHYLATGSHEKDYHYTKQEMGSCAHFIAQLVGANASVYSISTACTSSAKAMISGQRLLKSGIADIVIAGGVDSLCKMTINGFHAIASLDHNHSLPFQKSRAGINIGEGAGLFLMSRIKSDIALSGFGESSDAHHISAPHPEGKGAKVAMEAALQNAKLNADEINYINLHGTGTVQNDAMEAKAVNDLFSRDTPCSTSKHIHGHCLGAAGAIEAGLCWLLLSSINKNNSYPSMYIESEIDDTIDRINLTVKNEVSNITSVNDLQHCMSNSYAFGGNNASLILSKT